MRFERAWLACQDCRKTYSIHEERYGCDCGGELAVGYDYGSIARRGRFESRWRAEGGLWQRFSELLPLAEGDSIISLGEGGTPLARSSTWESRLPAGKLWFKLESCNPTGSFKDRQISVAVSKALSFGGTRFGTISSGNVGVALSAYCAKAGLEALVWVSDSIPAAKLLQIRVHGARVFILAQADRGDGDAHQDGYDRMAAYCLDHGLVPMVTARSANPYTVEGAKTIAFELVASLGTVPDRIFAPIGGGGCLGGVWKGFNELRSLGLTDTLPVLEGVQCGDVQLPVNLVGDRSLQGDGRFRPLDAAWAWRSICESRGVLRAVTKEEIVEAQHDLATSEGLFAEPQGAMAAAGLRQAAARGELEANQRVVCLVTGSGLKNTEIVEEIMGCRGMLPDPVRIQRLDETRM